MPAATDGPLRLDEVGKDSWLIHGSLPDAIEHVAIDCERCVISFQTTTECHTCGSHRYHRLRLELRHPSELSALAHVIARAREVFDRAWLEKQTRLSMGGRG